MEVGGQFHTPAALPLGKELQYPLDRMLGRPQGQSGGHGEEKILVPPVNRTPVVQPVA
jgi:hypothetical protein